MNKKKVLLSVLALILVCALSVAGTLAVLNKTTGTLTNTFIASATPDNFVNDLYLKEHTVTPDNKGGYTKDDATGTAGENEFVGNTYKTVPGVEVPKHAYVELRRENETPAYLYIEVVATDMDDYNYTIDSRWVNLPNATGAHGGAVYVLGTAVDAPTVIGKVEIAAQYDILTGNKVTAKETLNKAQGTLTFYAYIAQATVAVEGVNTNDATAVYNACF